MQKSLNLNNPCTIYLVRHGETDWNKMGIMQGQKNIPLNSKGKEQALVLHKKLKNVKFDAIFSSDLFRAKQTAEIIAKERKLIISTTKMIRERFLGKMEGEKFLDFKKKFLELVDLKNRELLEKKHNIETFESVVSRLLTFIRQTAFAYPGKKVLVVTHGTALRMILSKLGFIKTNEYWKIHVKNTAFVKIETDGNEIRVKKMEGVTIPSQSE